MTTTVHLTSSLKNYYKPGQGTFGGMPPFGAILAHQHAGGRFIQHRYDDPTVTRELVARNGDSNAWPKWSLINARTGQPNKTVISDMSSKMDDWSMPDRILA